MISTRVRVAFLFYNTEAEVNERRNFVSIPELCVLLLVTIHFRVSYILVIH